MTGWRSGGRAILGDDCGGSRLQNPLRSSRCKTRPIKHVTPGRGAGSTLKCRRFTRPQSLSSSRSREAFRQTQFDATLLGGNPIRPRTAHPSTTIPRDIRETFAPSGCVNGYPGSELFCDLPLQWMERGWVAVRSKYKFVGIHGKHTERKKGTRARQKVNCELL